MLPPDTPVVGDLHKFFWNADGSLCVDAMIGPTPMVRSASGGARPLPAGMKERPKQPLAHSKRTLARAAAASTAAAVGETTGAATSAAVDAAAVAAASAPAASGAAAQPAAQ